jgi:hypothetical protein
LVVLWGSRTQGLTRDPDEDRSLVSATFLVANPIPRGQIGRANTIAKADKSRNLYSHNNTSHAGACKVLRRDHDGPLTRRGQTSSKGKLRGLQCDPAVLVESHRRMPINVKSKTWFMLNCWRNKAGGLRSGLLKPTTLDTIVHASGTTPLFTNMKTETWYQQ